jgi:hypothetical protein
VRACSHVGGHQYAGNVLAFSRRSGEGELLGDWYGYVGESYTRTYVHTCIRTYVHAYIHTYCRVRRRPDWITCVCRWGTG